MANKEYFPYPIKATPEGVVAVGGELNVECLLEAYSKGIFPWPQEGLPMLWFCPPTRGILFFDEFHVPEKMKKKFNKMLSTQTWELKLNSDFATLIAECAQQPRPGQAGTWISEAMKQAYLDFYKQGYVLSFEVWQGSQMVGGLYGVLVGGVFSGESMFHKITDASKAALIFAVDFLSQQGISFMDTQMVTPVIAAFGGREISRQQYLDLLEQTQQGYLTE